MSTTAPFPNETESTDISTTTPTDSVRILTATDPIRYPLDDPLSLEVRGRPFEAEAFDVRLLLSGSPLLAKPVPAAFFDQDRSRDAFARSVASLATQCSSVASDAESITADLTAAFDELADRIGANRVVVGDEPVRQLIESSTERVVYTPESGRWTVVFGREYDSRSYEYTVKKTTFSASEWADHSARGKGLSSALRDRDRDPFPDDETGTARWRACRRAWAAMAEVGPEPPSVEAIELETPADVSDLPSFPSDVSGDQFVELVKDGTPPHVFLHEYGIDRRLLLFVASELGVKDELE